MSRIYNVPTGRHLAIHRLNGHPSVTPAYLLKIGWDHGIKSLFREGISKILMDRYELQPDDYEVLGIDLLCKIVSIQGSLYNARRGLSRNIPGHVTFVDCPVGTDCKDGWDHVWARYSLTRLVDNRFYTPVEVIGALHSQNEALRLAGKPWVCILCLENVAGARKQMAFDIDGEILSKGVNQLIDDGGKLWEEEE